MKIDAIDVLSVEMPFSTPFRTSFGETLSGCSVFVRMTSGEQSGWGESAPLGEPVYSPEWADGAFLVITRFLAPLLLGKDVTSGEQLQQLLSPVKGNPFAKAALDQAWWDLHARSRDEPLWKTLGGKSGTVEVGADFGIKDTIGELLELIDEAVNAGFSRIKLKYRPGWDLDMVRAVRKAYPDTTMHVDCNSAYTLDDIDMFRKLDEFDLAMIEQPLAHNDLIDHAKLQRELKTPLCLDESITSADKARKAIEIGACKWVNIKPGRVGGLTNAIAIHDLCRAAGVPCWVGGMMESSVGGYQCLALATLDNFKYPADVFPSDRFYTLDLGQPSIVLSSPSHVTALDAPGCGAEPDAERLKGQTVQSASLRA